MSSDLKLTEAEEQRIIRAIAEAERTTSCEIRVHLEPHCRRDPLERAEQVFQELGMAETRRQNGILIYIAMVDHKAAVYAGKGIHKQVADDFWNSVLELLLDYFRRDAFEAGIAEAVQKVGRTVAELYPYRQGVVNELPDDISYQDNRNKHSEE